VQTERLAAMGQTVASLSHSIKNILQGLRGGADAVELALDKGELDLAREGWPILSRNLDRIYTLTINMLAYSRRGSLDVELADLHGLVREAGDLLAPLADRKRVGVLLDLAEDMPPIPLDVNGLHQALVNVIMNAVEAAPAKKGVVTIKTRYDPAGLEATVVVADNGPGMDAARLETIFEAFRSTKGQRGTGLGLAVTRKIVEEHGGRIEIESSPGEGTSVHITLPSDRGQIDSSATHLPRPMPGDDLEESF
jgi:signal transduction histidine kinase